MNERPLLINGFMATGKSTLARAVADRTGRPLVDLDARLEQRTGVSIPEFFERHGEAAFRKLERAELSGLLRHWRSEFTEPPVCAVGGGALVDRPTRLEALRHAVVVTLHAELATLLERARVQGGRPLLQTADQAVAASNLLQQRSLSYAEANATLWSDRLSQAELLEATLEVWRRDALAVAAGSRSYVVEVGPKRLERCLSGLVEPASSLLLVSDRTVYDLYAARVQAALGSATAHRSVVLEPGEQAKTLTSIERIYRAALEHGLDRHGMLLGLGGGVVTDMTGFAAASWLRGVPWVAVASTLLAMVDASVGGKTGVDFGPAKNSVGAFWQPRGVICDTQLLCSESDRAYRGALAEVVKTALIGDAELFELLERAGAAVLRRDPELVARMVRRCVALKAWVVATDERETDIRAWLNLGHTLGHALEAHGDYARLTHGEAVSLGLVAALRIGQRLGRTPPELVARTTALLASLGLPCDLKGEPLSEAAELLSHDKKRAGNKIRFVFAQELGKVALVPLELDTIKRQARALTAISGD